MLIFGLLSHRFKGDSLIGLLFVVEGLPVAIIRDRPEMKRSAGLTDDKPAGDGVPECCVGAARQAGIRPVRVGGRRSDVQGKKFVLLVHVAVLVWVLHKPGHSAGGAYTLMPCPLHWQRRCCHRHPGQRPCSGWPRSRSRSAPWASRPTSRPSRWSRRSAAWPSFPGAPS